MERADGRGVVIDLRPDRCQRWFATKEGEVFLVADADGDEPPEAQYEWSAEPGR